MIFIRSWKRVLLAGAIFACFGGGAFLYTSRDNRPRLGHTNVLFILIDTLHAAHLGSYNPDLHNSPNIDALAAGGVRFANAFSVSSWTKPSIASIFTSMLPSHHGLTRVRDKLAPARKTLSEVFKDNGYRTIGVASHIYLDLSSGIPQGFDRYEQLNKARGLHSAITSDMVSTRAISLLDETAAAGDGKPFFMFLHYFDPHFRYVHHPEHDLTSGYTGTLKPQMSVTALEKRRSSFQADDIAYLKNLYREEIAYTDTQIGRILTHLRDAGLSESTLVVLTADHGEEFMEHGGLTHTKTLYDELLRIPLIFSLPGKVKPAVVSLPVDQLDILPTLHDLLLPGPGESEDEWEGRSLAPLLLGESSSVPPRDLISEVSYASVENPRKITVDLISVRSGRHKLIRDRIGKRWLLFDLQPDPDERHNIAGRRKDVVSALGARMKPLAALHEQQRNAASSEQEEQLRQEEVKKLKSLGYF